MRCYELYDGRAADPTFNLDDATCLVACGPGKKGERECRRIASDGGFGSIVACYSYEAHAGATPDGPSRFEWAWYQDTGFTDALYR